MDLNIFSNVLCECVHILSLYYTQPQKHKIQLYHYNNNNNNAIDNSNWSGNGKSDSALA